MEIDKTTLEDLSIMINGDSGQVFDKLDRTATAIGKEQLKKDLSAPLTSLGEILDVQHTIRRISELLNSRPSAISNGTIMIVERFYETIFEPMPANINNTGAYFYQLMHGPDFSLAKYSLQHCLDFLRGMAKLSTQLNQGNNPKPLRIVTTEIKRLLESIPVHIAKTMFSGKELSRKEILQLASFSRYHFKYEMNELLKIYARLDAWYSMASVMKELRLTFPVFEDTDEPLINTKGLFHLLLNTPVPYDITLDRSRHFMFLTGANMAGKSTFIKSVGIAVFLAHTGMGVPATEMKLSLFDGLLSNINVIDNIIKGESYFFNEVQRIKSTIEKVSDGKKWLILIDELFKGTNMQDAMKCSQVVIEGLLKSKNSIFILSTHLYELGEELQKNPAISFNYFETSVIGEQLHFSYALREGTSKDRLGYLIMAREGVVKLLQELR